MTGDNTRKPGADIKTFLRSLVSSSRRRPTTVTLSAWGKQRTFAAFDLFDDTFIFEDGIWDRIENKDSVIMLPKEALCEYTDKHHKRVFGNIMTVSSGNHAVTSIPLLSGHFWDFPALPDEAKTEVLTKRMVYANCVGNNVEISQREVSTDNVVEMDDWLQNLGYPMRNVVLIDRTDSSLQHYSHRGQEWRIKPLAWTLDEIAQAITSSISRMHSCLKYYHNVKGVHFLSYRNFMEWGQTAHSDRAEFMRGLAELAGTSEEMPIPNIMLTKYRDHHEVEFFGVPTGFAESVLVPAIMDLYEHAKRETEENPERQTSNIEERFNAIAENFRSALMDPQYADDSSPDFMQAIYRNITGQIYFDDHFNVSSAFDDMRTALPGATYIMGNRFIHDSADPRTIAILDSLEHEISHGDKLEYVNVYEIRSNTEQTRLGEGKSREIVYKTSWNPRDTRMIEKRLAQRSTGYGAYTLARVCAFRSLGISYGRHRLLARNDGAAGDIHYFTRGRYPGLPFNKLPKMYFFSRDPVTGKFDTESESADIVRVLMILMGGAAAENLVLKKYRVDTESNRFCQGKEIVEFGYDIRYGREMPLRIHLCSIRGTMGWPDWSCSQENLDNIFDVYTSSFASMVRRFADEHPILPEYNIADAFFDGFSGKTRELYWNYINRREQFDNYDPRVFKDYNFREKWTFVLWSLEKQREQLNRIYDLFHAKFSELAGMPAPEN